MYVTLYSLPRNRKLGLVVLYQVRYQTKEQSEARRNFWLCQYLHHLHVEVKKGA